MIQRRHKNWGEGLASLGDDAAGSLVRSEKNERQESYLKARLSQDKSSTGTGLHAPILCQTLLQFEYKNAQLRTTNTLSID